MNGKPLSFDKHRLAGLQDGIYSIAMTLLVLELKLPQVPEHTSDAQLLAALLLLWPKALTWLLTFWVLGVFWLSDVRVLASQSLVSRTQVGLSLARLALVSLLPFSTAVVGEYGDHVTGSALYSAHIIALAGIHLARVHGLQAGVGHAGEAGEAAPADDARVQAIATLSCAAIAFGLAFVVPGYCMFALVPALLIRFRRINRAPIRASNSA